MMLPYVFNVTIFFKYNVPLFSKYKVTLLLQILIKCDNRWFTSCFHAMTPCLPNVVLADVWWGLMTGGIVNDTPTSLTLINLLTLSRPIEGQTYTKV